MTSRFLAMILLVALVVGGILGFKKMEAFGTSQGMKAMGMPAQTVSTAKAAMSEWQPQLDAVGTLRAVNGADVSPEVAGIVDRISFESGGDVEKGAALVHLRDDDDIARLRALEAAAKLAQITYERDEKQVKAQAISQATFDNDSAALDSARAQVVQQQAILDKKTIVAPFAGHLGIRRVDIGQYLNPGAPIVTLQQLDPIYVDFTVPEASLPHIAIGQKVAARAGAEGNAGFKGEITAVNSKVDEATRNVLVRATFSNPDRKLLPGMFATVTVSTGASVRYITLPQTAITYNPYGNTVFIVENSATGKPVVRQQFVTLGAVRGDQVAVLTGLKEGDEVVTSGQVKLRNGMPVTINNEIRPTDDANPKPKDE